MFLAKLKKVINNVIKYVLIALLVAMCAVVFWQVVSRYVIGKSSRWSEEVARYIMVWIAFIGAAAGVTNKSHLGFTLLTKRIKDERLHKAVTLFSYLMLIFFSYALVHYGYIYAVEGAKQRMMSLPVTMSWVYGVIPAGGLLIILNSIFEIIGLFNPGLLYEEEVISEDE